MLLALVMVVGLLAACGSANTASSTASSAASGSSSAAASSSKASSSSSAASSSSADKAVTLTVWRYDQGGGDDAAYQAWADEVHKEYPNITIEFEILPFDSGPKKFTVACATNTTPDIYIDGYSRCAPAVTGGLCIDLTDIIKAHTSDFIEGTQVAGVIDGKNYFLTTAKDAAYCVSINKTLAEKLGVADLLPKDDKWSYDDYLKLLRAAKAADSSIYPTALWAGSRSSDAVDYSWLLAAKSEITNKDLTATAFNSADYKDKSLGVFNLFKTINDEGLCPAGAATLIDEDLYTYWKSGTLLCRMSVAWNNASEFYSDMQSGDSQKFDYDMYTIPTPDGSYVPTVASWGYMGWCAFDNGGHTDAIKKAIEVYLKDPESYDIPINKVAGTFPIWTSHSIKYEDATLAKIMDRGQQYSAQYTRSDFGILEGWWTDFRETLYPQLQDLYTGKIDSQTLLNNWQTNADAVIKKALAG